MNHSRRFQLPYSSFANLDNIPNIISVSRRTDIPAFFSAWFQKRLEVGFVVVRNPYNSNQIKKISLKTKDVFCFVFWTKNPNPMLWLYPVLNNYAHYYLITITGYGKKLEPYVPSVEEVIEAIKKLQAYGLTSNSLVWRYDPIIFNDTYTANWHYDNFERLACNLEKYINTCIISFFDVYNKKLASWNPLVYVSKDELYEFSAKLLSIAQKYGIRIQTCSEDLSFEIVKLSQGACIDAQRILRIRQEQGFLEKSDQNFGPHQLNLDRDRYQLSQKVSQERDLLSQNRYQLSQKIWSQRYQLSQKVSQERRDRFQLSRELSRGLSRDVPRSVFMRDKNQRSSCLCCKSIDIGAYRTCGHGCVYCYAHGRQKPYEQKTENSWFGFGTLPDSIKL